MKHQTNLILAALAVAVTAVISPQQAHAQGKLVKVGTPTVQSQKTPDYNVQGPKKKRWTQKEWVEIEVPFTVIKLPKDAIALEALTFRYFVLIDAKPKRKLLSTSLNHTNVPGKENVASVVYISPQTMQKFAKSTRVTAPSRLVKAYGVEIEYQGEIVGFFDSTGKKSPEGAFWKKGDFESADGLLAKKDTPFAPLWSDYHMEVR